MWKIAHVYVFWLCLESYLGHPQYDLGQQISQQVQDSLRGLDHLGSDIQANVQQQLRDAGIHNLGSRISADVERQVAPLHNLGAEIEERVHTGLLPVYAMGIRKQMADGIGGTTVVTYNSKTTPRSFIIKNGIRSVCKGTIRASECDGTLEPYTIINREDYCYTNQYAYINNNVCLSTGRINVIINNNHFSCNSDDNSPVLILTQNEFQNLCGNVKPGNIVYKYFANSNDLRAIPIPNSNPYVKCRNGDMPRVCEFESDNTVNSNTVISSGNNVSVRGGNIITYSNGGSYYNGK